MPTIEVPETRPYEVEYADLNTLIAALERSVEITNDTDERRILLGALLARKNNDKAIEEAVAGALDGATADDFEITEAEVAWRQ